MNSCICCSIMFRFIVYVLFFNLVIPLTASVLGLGKPFAKSFKQFQHEVNLDSDKILKVCTLFGFNKDSSDLCNSIFVDISANSQASIISVDSPQDMFSLCGQDVACGYISKYALLSMDYTALPFIQSIVDGVVLSKLPSKLILIIESQGNNANVFEQRVADIISNAVVKESQDSANYIDIQIVRLSSNNSAQASGIVKKSVEVSLRLSKGLNSKAIAKMMKRSKSIKPINGVESYGDCSHLEDSFVSRIYSSMNTIVEKNKNNMTRCLHLIEAELKDALLQHSKINNQVLTKYASSEGLQTCVGRTRFNLITVLSSVFHSLAEEIIQTSNEYYSNSLVKLKMDNHLPKDLNVLLTSSVKNTTSSLSNLQKEFMTLSMLTVEGTLLSALNDATMKKNNRRMAQSIHDSMTTAFNSLPIIKRLASNLQQRNKDIVSHAFYEGQYNPYVRMFSFPPLKVVFNYAFNPAHWFSAARDRWYYDAPGVGYANRADTLRFPGLLSGPFDPKDNPSSHEAPYDRKTPWWIDLLPNALKYDVIKKRI